MKVTIIDNGTCASCGASAEDCICGDYVDTAPLSDADKAILAENPPAKVTQQELDSFFGIRRYYSVNLKKYVTIPED